MSEENKENGFNHVKTFTKIIFIFSVLVFNDNESKLPMPPSIYLSRFNEKFIMRYFILMFTFVCSFVAAQPTIVPQLQ
ncbi:small protein involved in the cell envelope stress response [Escherichia coli]|uniref:Small protein involved in the cell envelope stress response n=2 Tax=Enterobacteriaceae TaxID=543 RepID=A0A376TU04_ECOLX|nr:small protein involved in the cell envelope stress response [Escherichia coli]